MTVAQLLADIASQLQSLGNGSITAAVHRSVLNNIVNSLTSIAVGAGARVAKTSAYTVVAADAGYLIDCTSGTFSLSLTAAATLGSGFWFQVINSGSGTVTIDPNGSEAIRDSSGTGTTNALTQGQGGLVFCDGTGWFFLKSGNISAVIQAALDLKAALASPALTGTPTAPTATAGTDTTQIATTAFVKAAVDLAVVGLFDLKGSTDCSANPNYPSALKGDAYIVSVAGKIGGASGTAVSVGDVYFANADNAGGTEGSVGTSWEVLEANIPGITAAGLAVIQAADAAAQRTALGLGTLATQNGTFSEAVIGPESATDNAIARYDSTTGKLLQSSGASVDDDGRVTANGFIFGGTVNAQTGTSYTLLASDNGGIVTLSNASAIALTVPSGLGAKFSCLLIQKGAGQVTIAGSGATVNSFGGALKIAGQNGQATLFADASNNFFVGGNLTT